MTENNRMGKLLYMDYAATTPLRKEVLESMLPYFMEDFGNASAMYPLGLMARKAVQEAREKVAAVIGAALGEIYFTSGGTEADNWVLQSVVRQYRKKEKIHIITTAIEHHAILHSCRALEDDRVSVSYLLPDAEGRISPAQVEEAIRPETVLISVMFANNEIGTIQPISEIGEAAEKHGILFHTDAVQAFGHEKIDVEGMKIDYLSASAHKLGGPKGVGCLYMRKGKALPPYMHGGAQEKNRRAGTENIPGIVGFGYAAALAMSEREAEAAREREIRDHMIARFSAEIPDCRINGALGNMRLSNNISLLLPGLEGERLVNLLGQWGLAAGAGSACANGDPEPSHVLRAIGVSYRDAFSQLRLTIGPSIGWEEADYAVDQVKKAVAQLRDRDTESV